MTGYAMNTEEKNPYGEIDMHTRFVHGRISRRMFTKQLACAGLAGGLIEGMMATDAAAQQIREDDFRIKASWHTVPAPEGNGYIRGYLVRPDSADSRAATATKLPGIVLAHEIRGLNPHIMDVARRLALENFMVFAPDALTSVGGYPGTDFEGRQLLEKLDPRKRTQDFVAAARWLKARPDCSGTIGVTGFSIGGQVANALAGILGADLAAAVSFYGFQTPPADVPKIKAAILIHHGALDKLLVDAYPAQEAELKKNNIRYEGHIWPDSGHGFFNDATPERYNKVTAPQAWSRTIEWLNQYVRT